MFKKKGGYQKKSFGGSSSASPWRGSDERPAMHPAVCEKCGASCEVPFKPNGRKPVFCRNCYVKEENQDVRFGEKSFDRPKTSYGAKPQYVSTPHAKSDNDEVVKQLKLLNQKMDALLSAFADLDESEEDEEES